MSEGEGDVQGKKNFRMVVGGACTLFLFISMAILLTNFWQSGGG